MKDKEQHPPAVYETLKATLATLAGVNKSTDLGLARVMWTIMSGGMVNSRGGLIPALDAAGFDARNVMHGWAASRRRK